MIATETQTQTFLQLLDGISWDGVQQAILAKTTQEVEKALYKKSRRDLDDFQALISPAAAPYLEEMAQLSHRLTLQRFGRTIQLYAPMYLSNECYNICTYCGFSFTNKMKRTTLNPEQILKEVDAIKALGFDHVLLVTGEAPRTVGPDYFEKVLRLIRPYFSQISMEVQPLKEHEYARLLPFGLHSVLVYQETYRQEHYRDYHIRGMKTKFDFRVETPDRLGRVGIHKIGLGILIGLEDWRADSYFCALHLRYLQKKYWKTKYSISFPRLRPAEGIQGPSVHMADRELVQLICAYRLLDEDVELSISTRESRRFRDHILRLGVTTMSAGSRTNPGGYAVDPQSLEQFEIDDDRSPAEVAAMIRASGYEPVWKDWDRAF